MNEELFLKFIKIANNKELDILSYFIANIETTITSEEDKDNLYYFLLENYLNVFDIEYLPNILELFDAFANKKIYSVVCYNKNNAIVENPKDPIDIILKEYKLVFIIKKTDYDYALEALKDFKKNLILFLKTGQIDLDNRKKIIISRSNGIYDPLNKKAFYHVKNKRLEILFYLKDNINDKSGQEIADKFYNGRINSLSTYINEINKNFINKLGIRDIIDNSNIDKDNIEKDWGIIIHIKTGGYDLNHKKYNIIFKE